jgi:integrase
MPRKPSVPAYRLQRQSGKAIVTLRDSITAERYDVLLGIYDTATSRAEYQRVLLDWEVRGRRIPSSAEARPDQTIAELIDRYWRHVESYYRRADGTSTGEVQCFTYALRPLNHLHGPTLARDFGPMALKAVRELMITGYRHPEYGAQPPICRTQINARVKRIRRMFKWAVENELVSSSVLQGLQAVAALKRGRSEAREAPPVLPVSRRVVEDTLPLLRPMQADMVRLQLESGMRPGELVAIRRCDIDMTGAVWLYRPGQHKTEHHGHQRVISLGPKCQAIIRRYLSVETQAHLFSPRKNMEERRCG